MNGKDVSCRATISDKFVDVHNELYTAALSSYLNASGLTAYTNAYTFIERVDETKKYYESSYVMVTSKATRSRTLVDLSYYWPEYYYNTNKESIDTQVDALLEVIYIDYVHGRYKVRNRYTDEMYHIAFSEAPEDLKVSDDLLYTDHFSYLHNNNIFN